MPQRSVHYCKKGVIASMSIEAYGNTNIGKIRKINEDSFAIYGFKDDSGFAVIADGMGGHNAGEIASATAVDEIRSALEKSFEADESIPSAITSAVNAANRRIFDMSIHNKGQSGMGTTVIITAVKDGAVYAANVGDSRIYLMYDGKLRQVTKDHSFVEELITAGSITREEAATHPGRHTITRAVGTDARVKTDIFELECKVGDVILMCSDGLSDMLSPVQIEKIISQSEKISDAVESLIAAANESGGADNITLVGIKFTSDKQSNQKSK